MLKLLFGFNGRVRRSQWWLARIGTTIGAVLIGGVIVAFSEAMFGRSALDNGEPAAASAGGLLILAVLFFYLWTSLAVTVKRWHDRDKSGFFVLIGMIPLIGPIWTLIECGCLDGTQGPNQFGRSPKGIGDAAEAFA